MQRIVVTIGCLLLLACASDPGARLREANRTTPQMLVERPVYPGYGAALGRQNLSWTRASLATDFAKLMFETEWGGKQPKLLKWDEHVTVAIASDELNAFRPEIAEYLATLDANTPDLSISLVTGSTGDIILRSAPAEEMVADAPSLQCFFTPVDMDWPAFAEADRKGQIDWGKVERLQKVTIFVPAFAAPYTIRGCLAEELIQALGPGNDLYGLEDSLFNDDDAHIWPTAFDLSILSLLYSEDLAPGMDRETAVEAVKLALARNAEGVKQREWTSASRLYHTEYHRYFTSAEKAIAKRALTRAFNFSKLLPENDHRRGEVRRAQALAANRDDDFAGASRFAEEAISIFRLGLPNDSPRLARVLSDYGFILSNDGQYKRAIVALDEALPALAAHALEDEFVLSLRLRAYAHIHLGNRVKALSAARETMAWARYAYGADSAIVRRWSEEFRSHDLPV